MSREPALAPGVVRVRLSGAAADVDAVAAVFSGAALAGFEVIESSARYPNRREPGERLYLTVRAAAGRTAAGPGRPDGPQALT